MCRNAATVKPSIATRVRAARVIGGYNRPQDLAAAIGGRGLGATNLYKIERGERAPAVRELYDIAAACGLELEFFTADFERLREISEDPRKVIARETAEAVRRSVERRSKRREGSGPPPPADPER
jgi:hypothetical protein